jgi:PKD repeat protein
VAFLSRALEFAIPFILLTPSTSNSIYASLGHRNTDLVIRGNIYIDRNFNQMKDEKEECVFASALEAVGCQGDSSHPLQISLTGKDSLGTPVALSANVAIDGSFTFSGLNPGRYMLCEAVPNGFSSFRPCTLPISLDSTLDLGFVFGNYIDAPVPASDARYDGCWLDDGVGGVDTLVLHRIPNGNIWRAAPVDPEWTPIVRNQFEVHFRGVFAGDNDPEHHSFRWDFGDGQVVTTVQPLAIHTYARTGFYNVSLVPVDARTGTAVPNMAVTHPLVIGPAHPFSIDFSFTPSPLDSRSTVANPQQVDIRNTVTFAATTWAGSPPYTLSWDFGDGSTAVGAKVTHQYSRVGLYTVSLSALDSQGLRISAQHQLSVDIVGVVPGARFAPPALDFYFRVGSFAPRDPPTILEGRVPTPAEKFPNAPEAPNNQAPSEVAEQDSYWSHYTPDKTFEIKPDPGYQHVLASGVNPDGSVGQEPSVEVEWEEALAFRGIRLSTTDSGGWGSLPSWAWPSVGDRVWVEGRWVFDCGHNGLPTGSHDPALVHYGSEIHPPRALVTFRLNHAVEGDELPPFSACLPPGCQPGNSWLPATGSQTAVPVTQADIFVSGNGGGAADICSVNTAPYVINDSIIPPGNIEGTCPSGHTGPLIPVNDRNYVFDIYPPGTTFGVQKLPNGTFPVSPPRGARLQWRIINRPPAPLSCGNSVNDCRSVEPLLCPIDSTIPPPDQAETNCPTVSQNPTRLRVILPFQGSDANVFAKSILLGWDKAPDNSCPTLVPDPPATSTQTGRVGCAPIRTFEIRLHEYRILQNGVLGGAPWLVFIDVGGHWQFLNNATFGQDEACHPRNIDPQPETLLGVRSGSCFRFDGIPWVVTVQDGTPIHVALGGFLFAIPMNLDCRNRDLHSGCEPSLPSISDKLACVENDCTSGIRVGTYEFDLNAPLYPAPGLIDVRVGQQRESEGVHYQATFTVKEITPEPLLSATGKIIFLRVNDVGTGFGAGSDFLDAEVVVLLDSEPGKAFGFKLRPDEEEESHSGMLEVLRSAYKNNRTVRLDYIRRFQNGTIVRVESVE